MGGPSGVSPNTAAECGLPHRNPLHMTLIESKRTVVEGYYKTLIQELGLESEFAEITGEDLSEHSLEVSERTLIEEVLEEAPGDYLIISPQKRPVEYWIEVL